MCLFELLHANFANFPIIKEHQLDSLRVLCVKQLREITRITRIPTGYTTQEEQATLSHQKFFVNLLSSCASQPELNLIQVFNEPIFTDCIESLISISSLWSDCIDHLLLNKTDELQIYVPYLFLELFYQPALITGLIIALIKNNTSAEMILSSGMLHNFFAHHCIFDREIKNAYTILQTRQHEHPEIAVLLAHANQTYCGIKEYSKTSLDTVIHPHKIPEIVVRAPEHPINFSEPQFAAYMQLFDYDFIVLTLINHPPQIYDVLTNWITRQEDSGIEKLYIKMLECSHPSNFRTLFTTLLRFTSNEIINQLFAEQPELFWILLALVPHKLQSPKKLLHSQALQHEVSFKNQDLVSLVAKQRKFKPIQEELFYKLFRLQLSCPAEFNVESELANDLFNFKKTSAWCLEHDQKIYDDLVELIDSFVTNSQFAGYIDIRDFYHSKLTEFQVLRALSEDNSFINSTDFFDFASLVLSRAFKFSGHKHLIEWLEQITSFYPKTAGFEEHILAHWFKNSSISNELLAICLILKKYVGFTNVQIDGLFKAKNLDIFEQIFKSAYGLSVFLQFFTEEERYDMILKKNNYHQHSILTKSLKKPDFLNVIFHFLSQKDILRILHLQHKTHLLWFAFAVKPAIKTIADKLTADSLQRLIELEDNDKNTVLHKHMDDLEFIKALLARHEKKYLYRIINHPKTLELAINHPASCIFLLSLLSKYQQYKVLNPRLLSQIIAKPVMLAQLLQLIKPNRFPIISAPYASMILSHYAENHELVNLLFINTGEKKLPALLFSNKDLYEKIPSAMILISALQKLSLKNRVLLLIHEHNFFIDLICRKHLHDLPLILNLLTSRASIKLLASDYFFETILRDKHLMTHYFSKLKPLEMALFAAHKNSQQKTWSDIISCNQAILATILANILRPSIKEIEKLVGRFIKDPGCINILLELIPHHKIPILLSKQLQIRIQTLSVIESFFCIFKFLPPNLQASALFWKHSKYTNMYLWLCSELDKTLQFLQQFSPEALETFTNKFMQNAEQMKKIKKHPQRINDFFAFLSSTQRLQFLIALCNFSKSEQLEPVHKEIIRNSMLNCGVVTKQSQLRSIRDANFFADCLPVLEEKAVTLAQINL